MRAHLDRWLGPPTFVDEEATLTARLLHRILLLTVSASGVFSGWR